MSVLLCALATESFAWGRLGHEIAGAVARDSLSDTARQRVESLLPGESLAEASHWADRMRGDPALFWQEEAGPYHYVTIPPGRRYDQVGAPGVGDAMSALAMFRRELRDPSTPRERAQLALRFALHIVQDLQQPLHVGNGSDRGGNDVIVVLGGEPSNLHRVWDYHIIASARRSRDEWIARLQERGLLGSAGTQDDDARQWLRQSAALRDRLYPVPAVIGAEYLDENLPRVEERLALAGLRAAAWLNTTFASGAAEPEPRRRWWQRLFGR